MTFNTRAAYTQKPVRLAMQSWGAADQCTNMTNATGTYIHTMTKRILERTTESTLETTQYQIIQYTSKAIPTFGMYVSYKEYILIVRMRI